MMRHKAPIVLIVLFMTFVVVVLVGQMKNWSGITVSDEEKRTEQIVSISESIVSIGQTLISAIVSFSGLILRWIKNLILAVLSFLTSSVVTTTTTTPMTTSPIVITSSSSSSVPTASTTAVSTVPMATTTAVAVTSASMTSVMSPTSTLTTTTTPTTSSSSITTSSSSITTSSSSITTTTSSTTTTTSSIATSTASTTSLPPTKVAFVTNETFNGALGGVDGADAICSLAAMRASLDGNFLAWISNSSTSPSIRFTESVDPYVRVDGTVIAANYSSLVGIGTLLNPLNVNEYGQTVPTTNNVWTYTDNDGTDASEAAQDNHCQEWMMNGGNIAGAYGSTTATMIQWTFTLVDVCSDENRLYCFQQ